MQQISKIFNIIITFLKKNILFIIPLILIIIIILLYIFFIKEPTPKDNISLEDGLKPITIILDVNNKDLEANLTIINSLILSNAINSDEDSKEVILNNIKNLDIKDLKMPPMPESKIKVSNFYNKKSIENYLEKVYNLYEEYPVDIDYQKLLIQASEDNFTEIDTLIKNNDDLYYKLFELKVPKEVILIHKQYIKMVQIDNSLLLSIKKLKQDPYMVEFNQTMRGDISSLFNKIMKQELYKLSEKYEFSYDFN